MRYFQIPRFQTSRSFGLKSPKIAEHKNEELGSSSCVMNRFREKGKEI